jgi:hypothetical protein
LFLALGTADLDTRATLVRERHVWPWILTLVVVYGLFRGLGESPYDDGYFFERVAENLLKHGAVVWNAGEAPVYGLTSQLFLLPALLLASAAPAHYVLGSKILLAICLLGAGVAVLVRMRDLNGRRAGEASLLCVAAWSSPLVLATIHSGMETALALLLVAVATPTNFAPGGSKKHAVRSALLAALLYCCRPDAAIIPCVVFWWAHWRERRVMARFTLALFLCVGSLLLLFWSYYGTAFPLPFYAKSVGLTALDESFRTAAFHGKVLHFLTFATFTAPLAAVCLWGDRRRTLPFFAGAAAFVLYHLLFTEDVMGYRARFFLPALVPLLFGAAAGWDAFLARCSSRALAAGLGVWAVIAVSAYGLHFVEGDHGAALDRVSMVAYLTAIAATAAAFVVARRRATSEYVALAVLVPLTMVGLPPVWSARCSDADYLARSSAAVTTVRGLSDLARCLPTIEQLYHSEIGVPGLVLPDARIVDLAGLMSKEIGIERPPFDHYCLRDQPEAIFLPHKNYVALNREILASQCLRDYTRVVKDSSSPLYIRNDLAPAFLACATDSTQWR